MSHPRSTDVDFAVELANEAASIAKQWFRSDALNTTGKSDGSPVTQADLAIEQRLREMISEFDPDASLVGEENGRHCGKDKRTWFIDPIDGTTPFSRGVPMWATLVALHDEHGPAIGVISMPAMGHLLVGVRGAGATLDGAPCRVNATPSLDSAIVSTYRFDRWPPELVADLQAEGAELRGWGDSYSWLLLASGKVDAVIDFKLNPWDIAPMQAIIPAAGGLLRCIPEGDDPLRTRVAFGANAELFGALESIVIEST